MHSSRGVKIEDTPERWVLTQSNGLLYAGLVAYLVAFVALLFAADAFVLRCDKRQDRCEFESHSLAASFVGQVRLSQVDYLIDVERVARTGRSRVASTARLRFVMRDRRVVELEENPRSSLVSDGIVEAFIAFRRSDASEMSRFALHCGELGLFAPLAMAIGAVLVLVAKRRRIVFDFAARRFSIDVSGVRIGAFRLEGALSDIESLEHVARGTQLGLWLKTRAGRRARIEFDAVEPLARAISERLAIPVVAQSDAVVSASLDRRSIAPSLVVVAIGLSPMALLALWPIVERLL